MEDEEVSCRSSVLYSLDSIANIVHLY